MWGEFTRKYTTMGPGSTAPCEPLKRHLKNEIKYDQVSKMDITDTSEFGDIHDQPVTLVRKEIVSILAGDNSDFGEEDEDVDLTHAALFESIDKKYASKTDM